MILLHQKTLQGHYSIAQNVIVKVKWIKDDPSVLQNWSLVDIQFTER
jgi:hypothetical protein